MNVNASYVSEVENDVFNTEVLHQSAYTQVDASLKYEPNDNWNVTLGGTNLTDKRAIVSGYEAGALPFTISSYNRPREWYLSFGYAF